MHSHSSAYAHRPHLGRASVAVSQPAQRRVVGAQQAISQRIGTVSQAQQPYHGCVSCARIAAYRHMQTAVSWAQGAVSWLGLSVVSRHNCLPNPCPPVTIHLGVLRYSSQQPPSLQYNPSHSSNCSHDTMFVL